MRRARGGTVAAQKSAPPRSDAPLEEQVARMVSSRRPGSASFLFFSVTLDSFERHVLDAHPYLDAFRLREDIRYFVGAFASDLGAAFPLPGSRYLIGLQGEEPRGVDLVVHQLGSFLTSLFGSYNGGAEIAVQRTRSFPEGGTDPAALVSFFTS